MSKIVILSAELSVVQTMDDLLQEIASQDSSLADWIRKLDTLPIIKECVQKAVEKLISQSSDIEKGSVVLDYNGKEAEKKSDYVLKTGKLPDGLGIAVTDQGKVDFSFDDYTSEWKKEIKRIRKLFTDIFSLEYTKSMLEIMSPVLSPDNPNNMEMIENIKLINNENEVVINLEVLL